MGFKFDEIETTMEFGNRCDREEICELKASGNAISPENSDADDALNRLRVDVPVEVNVNGAPQKAALN